MTVLPPLGIYSSRILKNSGKRYAKHWTSDTKHGDVRTDSNSTQCGFMIAPAPKFNRVRFLLKNREAVAPTAKIIVAVTNNAADRITPSVGATKTNNPANGWIDVTLNGNATIQLPAFDTGDNRSPNFVFTDWMFLPSIVPIDKLSNGMPYLMFRTKFSSPFTYWAQGATRTTIGYQPNFFDQYYNFGADRTVNPENATAANTTTYQDACGIHAVEFMDTVSGSVMVCCIGDSITQGVGDNTQGNSMGSYVPKAQAISIARGLPFNFLNYGQGSCPTVSYFDFGKRAVTVHRPAIAMYSVFSPNDGVPDANNTDTAFNRAIDFANHCHINNTVPVFTFLAPNDGYVANVDPFRKSLITTCKNSGVRVIDLTPAVGDGATPERFKPGFKNDNTHPNSVGYEAMAQLAITELTKIWASDGYYIGNFFD